MAFERAFPHVVVREDVRNQSERNHFGTIVKPTLIVIHDTEGGNIPRSKRDLQGLADWFNNPVSQASSHVATDEDGQSGRFVDDPKKAWTQAYFNSVGLSIEQIGYASDAWRDHSKDLQLRETARWVALWHRRFDIPIRTARVSSSGTVTRSGVIQHRRLGTLGGSHHDVSLTYPIRRVLSYAKMYADLQNEQGAR
jgi:hypothetical protein